MSKRMKFFVRLLITCITCFCLTSIMASATNNLIPYDNPSSSAVDSTGTATTDPSGTKDYAGNLFHQVEITKDEGAMNVVNSVATAASWLITVILGIFPALITIQSGMDVFCIAIRPLGEIIATVLPFRINSDECIGITGIQFAPKKEGAQATSIEKIELNGMHPLLCYFMKRSTTILIAVVFFLLLGTGILFDVIYYVANMAVGALEGIL